MIITSHASRRHTPSITLLSASLLAVSTPLLAKELRLGLITPPQHIWTQTAERFADEVAERSDGEMTVALFPSGQMGDESAMFSQMETGLLDMGIMTAALNSQREPSVVGWFTPFLFNSVEQAGKMAEHLTLTNHMAFPAVSVMSQATRASLSDEERQLIDSAMNDALVWGIEAQIEAEERNLSMLEERVNVYTLENAENAFSTANQAFAERFGEHPLIQAFQQQSTELLNAE